jgi:transposase
VIAVLRAEVEQLKRRVGMDSSNSSMPPGSDGQAGRAKRAKKSKKRSPRPRGGQAGHEGHGLARVADPDRVEVVTPDDCTGCGRMLAGVAGRVAVGVQVFDTPPVTLQVTEYRMLAVRCPGCRRVSRAAAPAGVAGLYCTGSGSPTVILDALFPGTACSPPQPYPAHTFWSDTRGAAWWCGRTPTATPTRSPAWC